MVFCADVEMLVECFGPEALFSSVMAAGQDEAPGSEGNRCKDVLAEWFSLAMWSPLRWFECTTPGVRDVATATRSSRDLGSMSQSDERLRPVSGSVCEAFQMQSCSSMALRGTTSKTCRASEKCLVRCGYRTKP